MQIHSHKPDRPEISDISKNFIGVADRNFELIPFHRANLIVFQLHIALFDIGNIVAAHLHVLFPDFHPVLIIALVFVQRIVIVDVFHIGNRGSGNRISFRRHFGGRGIAIRAVKVFVALQNSNLVPVKFRTSVIPEIVRRRVVAVFFKNIVIHQFLKPVQIVLEEKTLIGIVQTIQTNILKFPGLGIVIKGIHQRLKG